MSTLEKSSIQATCNQMRSMSFAGMLSGKTIVSDFRLNQKFLQKAGRQKICLNSHWRDIFIVLEELYTKQMEGGMFTIGQAIKLNNSSCCSVFLNFNRGLRNILFIRKAPYIQGFILGAILVTVYKFMLHLWGFLLKSKTECGHLLCCWLFYYHFLSEDRSSELISVDLSRHRGKCCQGRIKKKKRFLFYMDGCFPCIYVCTMCMPGAHMGQKRASDSLALELTYVVNIYAGAGNGIWAFSKSSQCS